VVLAAFVATSAVASVILGQDMNWDLLNYHFYDGYAALSGRLDRDIAPGGPQTYFNPLLDVLQYLGMRHLAPRVFGALLGALQGVNPVLIWAIVRTTLGTSGRWLAVLAAVLAATGQNAVSLLGTSFGDTTVSLPALAGVLALMGSERPGFPRFLLAGLAGGAAIGLKLTMVAPHIGLTVLASFVAWKQRRATLGIAFLAGTLAGWGLTGGWWALEMWSRFANPVFPLANDVFHSPYGPPYSVTFDRWSPRTPWNWFGPLLDTAFGSHERLQEIPFHDPRLLVGFLALMASLLVVLRRHHAGEAFRLPGRGLELYWLATYGAWFAVFHYYRYAAVLEMLAPALALIVLADVLPRRVAAVAPVLAVIILLSTDVAQWDRKEWTAEWFDASTLPPLAQEHHQLVLLPDPTTSYVIPFFPEDASFIGLFWGFGPEMSKDIEARVRRHRGPLLMVALPPRRRVESLRPLGLVVEGPCERIDFGAPTRPFVCRLSH
jgi:hypothetical protein